MDRDPAFWADDPLWAQIAKTIGIHERRGLRSHTRAA